jgi:hypothetical protein
MPSSTSRPTGHPLGQALKERGMNWVWCYLDKTLLASTAT